MIAGSTVARSPTNARIRPNENKMSDGGRGRASLGVGMWKSSQKWSAQRSAVRSIAWLGVCVCSGIRTFPVRVRSAPRASRAAYNLSQEPTH